MRGKSGTSRWILCLAFVLGLALSWPVGALATEPPQACTIKDFKTFLENYMRLPVAEQAECVVYPLAHTGLSDQPLPDKAAYLAALNERSPEVKIIISPDDLAGEIGPSNPFLTFDAAEIESRKAGYILRQDGNEGNAILTEGGTFVFSVLTFVWDGTTWRLTGVVEPE